MIPFMERGKEEIDEDLFWDKLEGFCSYLNIWPSSSKIEVYEWQQEDFSIPSIEPLDPTPIGQHDVKEVECNIKFNADCWNLALSRGCPIRHLA